jgi:hypothetical protein
MEAATAAVLDSTADFDLPHRDLPVLVPVRDQALDRKVEAA